MAPSGNILIVAAHPDDETIGAAIRLSRAKPATAAIVHLTNGAPRGYSGGFRTGEDYARARREELYSALALIGISPSQCRAFGYVDQEAARHLPEIAARLEAVVNELEPAVVLTHPYEGGHPDHDSAAFAVRRAVANRAPVVEFACYHAGPSGLETGRFLPHADAPEDILQLTAGERALKRRMFDCFASQREVLRLFHTDEERFRPAPVYDFSLPPHPGVLYYETQPWTFTGAEWRALAAEALALR